MLQGSLGTKAAVLDTLAPPRFSFIKRLHVSAEMGLALVM